MTVVPTTGAEHGRPIWQANKDSNCCVKCQRLFGIYHRRHHCRGCGKLVCDKCSEHRISFPESYGYGSGKVRVCSECYNIELNIRYEADLQRGDVMPPNYEELEQTLKEKALKYLELPDTNAVEREDQGVLVSTSHMEGSSLMVVRSQMTVKASPSQVRDVHSNMEAWKNWNPHISSRMIERVRENARVMTASYEFPVINKRDSCFFTCTIFGLPHNPDAPDAITTMAMSIEHPMCPPEKGVIRSQLFLSLTQMQSYDGGKSTVFTSIVHSDPRGLIPPILANRFLARGADHLRGMANYIEKTYGQSA